MSNPGYLIVDRGEELAEAGGPEERIPIGRLRLGKGTGKAEGAFAELPRYFNDAGRVMDLESRLVWCMETSRAVRERDPQVQILKPGAATELEALTTFLA